MSDSVRMSIRGLGAGQTPVAVIEIDLNSDNPLGERILGLVFGRAPERPVHVIVGESFAEDSPSKRAERADMYIKGLK